MSMAVVAVSMQAAGAVGSAGAAYYNAKAQKSALGFEADIAEINARQAEKSAQMTLAAGQREAQRSRMSTAALKSSQRAALAANGVALDEGSAVNVLTTTDYIGEVDANTIEANAIAAAWGHRAEATNQSNRAAMSRTAAQGISPGQAATSSLMGSATQIASSWYVMNKAGALDKPVPPGGGTPGAGSGLKTSGLSGFWGN